MERLAGLPRLGRGAHLLEPSQNRGRGYKYIIVEDELVILDPDTLEIVAVIPA